MAVYIKKDLDHSKLKDLGYVFSISEGGFISADGATIVNIYRSPYKRMVMQYCADTRDEHLKNVGILRSIGAVEVKKAQHRICQNNEHDIVFIDTIEGIGTEFESLDGFYCSTCNSFWREP